MSAHIEQAIADLKVRRDELTTAIGVLERLLGGPPAPASAPATPRDQAKPQPAPSTDDVDDKVAAACLKVVEKGPASTNTIADRVKVSAYVAKARLEALATKGLVHFAGVGRGAKWYLGAKGASRQQASSPEVD